MRANFNLNEMSWAQQPNNANFIYSGTMRQMLPYGSVYPTSRNGRQNCNASVQPVSAGSRQCPNGGLRIKNGSSSVYVCNSSSFAPHPDRQAGQKKRKSQGEEKKAGLGGFLGGFQSPAFFNSIDAGLAIGVDPLCGTLCENLTTGNQADFAHQIVTMLKTCVLYQSCTDIVSPQFCFRCNPPSGLGGCFLFCDLDRQPQIAVINGQGTLNSQTAIVSGTTMTMQVNWLYDPSFQWGSQTTFAEKGNQMGLTILVFTDPAIRGNPGGPFSTPPNSFSIVPLNGPGQLTVTEAVSVALPNPYGTSPLYDSGTVSIQLQKANGPNVPQCSFNPLSLQSVWQPVPSTSGPASFTVDVHLVNILIYALPDSTTQAPHFSVSGCSGLNFVTVTFQNVAGLYSLNWGGF